MNPYTPVLPDGDSWEEDYFRPPLGHYSRMPKIYMPESESSDPVNHPSHYGGDTPHEVIKCLFAWGLESDALLWNTVKYIARAGKKGPALEDLKKARFYLDRRIQEMEKKI